MKTITLIVLAICFSSASAQPVKRNPPPFDRSMSAYTQTNIQDTLFNKSPMILSAVLGTDSSTTAQTLTTVLSVAVPANQTYAVDIYVQDSTSTTAGNKYGITIPSGGTITGKAFGSLSSTTFTTDDIAASATAGAAYTTTVPTTNLGFWTSHSTVTTGAGGSIILKQLKMTSGTAIAKAKATYIICTRIR